MFEGCRFLLLVPYVLIHALCVWQTLNPPILLFVQSKERAKELYRELEFANIRAGVIHADLTQAEVIPIEGFISQPGKFWSATFLTHFSLGFLA